MELGAIIKTRKFTLDLMIKVPGALSHREKDNFKKFEQEKTLKMNKNFDQCAFYKYLLHYNNPFTDFFKRLYHDRSFFKIDVRIWLLSNFLILSSLYRLFSRRL